MLMRWLRILCDLLTLGLPSPLHPVVAHRLQVQRTSAFSAQRLQVQGSKSFSCRCPPPLWPASGPTVLRLISPLHSCTNEVDDGDEGCSRSSVSTQAQLQDSLRPGFEARCTSLDWGWSRSPPRCFSVVLDLGKETERGFCHTNDLSLREKVGHHRPAGLLYFRLWCSRFEEFWLCLIQGMSVVCPETWQLAWLELTSQLSQQWRFWLPWGLGWVHWL